jgi:hypothetical protein
MLTENDFGEAQGFLLAFCHDLKRDVHAIDHPLPENWRGYLVTKLKSSPALAFRSETEMARTKSASRPAISSNETDLTHSSGSAKTSDFTRPID